MTSEQLTTARNALVDALVSLGDVYDGRTRAAAQETALLLALVDLDDPRVLRGLARAITAATAERVMK